MKRRIKILVICSTIDKTMGEYLEWCGVMEEHMGKNVKCMTPKSRIETPYAIIDFVPEKPEVCRGYKSTFVAGEDEEKILRLATGEETV